MRTSATGSKATLATAVPREGGFSLVELIVALAIAGLMLAAAVPASVRFYEGMQARQSVRSTMAVLQDARERALSSGRIQDVMIRPATRRIWSAERNFDVPNSVQVAVHGAAELNHADTGVIRFYPEGGSSGGGVDLRRADGSGTAVNVDWLVGRVSLQPLPAGS